MGSSYVWAIESLNPSFFLLQAWPMMKWLALCHHHLTRRKWNPENLFLFVPYHCEGNIFFIGILHILFKCLLPWRFSLGEDVCTCVCVSMCECAEWKGRKRKIQRGIFIQNLYKIACSLVFLYTVWDMFLQTCLIAFSPLLLIISFHCSRSRQIVCREAEISDAQ